MLPRRLLSPLLQIAPSIVALLLPDRAAAEPPPSWGPLDVAVGAHAGFGPDSICQRELSDVVSCSPLAFAGVQLASRYRLSAPWSLGVDGSWSAASAQNARSLWTAAANGRFHPLGQGAADLYLGASAGIIVAVDSLAVDELGPPTTELDSAATLGGSIGADFRIGGPVYLGPELGGALFTFDGENSGFERAPDYPTFGVVLLRLNVSLRR